MTLTLRIRNVDSLENGMPVEFVLHRRGATIGRSPTCDWSLPDPRNHISFRHCEIMFSDNSYVVTDISTNGTFVNGSPERLPGQHRIAHGDVLEIGQYQVTASLSGSAAMEADVAGADGGQAATDGAGWYGGGEGAAGGSGDWAPQDQHGGAATGAGFAWDTPRSPAGESAPAESGWAPSHRAPDIAAHSTWEPEPVRPDPASGWSSQAPDRPPPPRTEDVWGRIAEGNVVDWARGGFGQPREPAGDPLGLAQQQPADWLPSQRPGHLSAGPEQSGASAAPGAARRPNRPGDDAMGERAAAKGSAPSAPADAEQLLAATLAAAGLSRDEVTGPPQDVAARIGALLRRLAAGLVVMVEARTRAKSQMGAETTSLQFDGNNPIKFARTPEQTLSQLINPPQRGFMESERSVEDAFFDLQSHQMATLKAMQGALKATLDRFSPTSIRTRAGGEGFLGNLLPMARKAAFWDSYEREFSGVALGSDEAFMDVFAKEFRKAYEELSRQQARR